MVSHYRSTTAIRSLLLKGHRPFLSRRAGIYSPAALLPLARRHGVTPLVRVSLISYKSPKVADLLGGPGSKHEPASKDNPSVAGSFLDRKRYSGDRHRVKFQRCRSFPLACARQRRLFSEDPQFHRTPDYQCCVPTQYTAAICVSQYANARLDDFPAGAIFGRGGPKRTNYSAFRRRTCTYFCGCMSQRGEWWSHSHTFDQLWNWSEQSGSTVDLQPSQPLRAFAFCW